MLHAYIEYVEGGEKKDRERNWEEQNTWKNIDNQAAFVLC